MKIRRRFASLSTLSTLSKLRRFDQSMGNDWSYLRSSETDVGAPGVRSMDARMTSWDVGRARGWRVVLVLGGVICCSAQEYGCIRARYSNTEEVNGGRLARQASEMEGGGRGGDGGRRLREDEDNRGSTREGGSG